MKLETVKGKAKDLGIAPGKLKKSELIRAIQRAEGNAPCFETARADQCGRENCLWRSDCK